MIKKNIFYSIVILQTAVLLFACGSSLKKVSIWDQKNDLNALFDTYAYKYKNEDVREAAKDALVRKSAPTVHLLLGKVASLYPEDRAAAASLLGTLKVNEAVGPLITLLTSDQDANVRIEAAKALGEIGDVKALRILAVYSQRDDNPDVRRYAGESARKLHSIIASPH